MSWSIAFYPEDHRRIDRIRKVIYQATDKMPSKSAIIRMAVEALEVRYAIPDKVVEAGLVDVQYAKEETAL